LAQVGAQLGKLGQGGALPPALQLPSGGTGGGGGADDDTPYFKLSGRSGGQQGRGGTGAAQNLYLGSTDHPTKGFVYLGYPVAGAAYDETNVRLGVNLLLPTAKMHIKVGASGQISPPTVVSGGADWQNIGGAGSFVIALTDGNDATYAQGDIGSSGTPLQGDFTSGMIDPGTRVGFTIKIRCQSIAGGSNAHMIIQISNNSGGGYWTTFNVRCVNDTSNPGDEFQAGGTFTTFTHTCSSSDLNGGSPGGQTINFSSQPWKYNIAFSGTPVGNGVFNIAQVEVDLPGASDTLQKWEGPSALDQLDFAADGAGASVFDMNLAGNAALRVSAGDATSGLRFLTASNFGRIEVGTAAQAAMDAILCGARGVAATSIRNAAAGTMISNTTAAAISAPAAILHIKNAGVVGDILFKLQRIAAQTGDLTEWLDSNGSTKLAFVDKDGKFTMPVITIVTGAAAGSLLSSVDATGLAQWVATTALSLEVKDTLFRIVDDGDVTKKLAWQVSGVTTGTTRTWTVQNASGTIPLLEFANTFTKKQTISPDTDIAGIRIVMPAGSVGTAYEVFNTDSGSIVSAMDSQGGNYATLFALQDIPIGLANNSVIIQAKTAISTGRIYKFDNSIASTDIMLTGGTQTVAGIKTFSAADIFSGGTRLQMDGTTTRVHMTDQADITKRLALLLTGITTGTTRVWTIGNWDGKVAAPIGDGTSTQVLTSNGAGVQPSWQAPPGAGSGTPVSVNGGAVLTTADLDDNTPAPPADAVNVKWQNDASSPINVSAYVVKSTVREWARTFTMMGA